jgi:hypothetical protein
VLLGVKWASTLVIMQGAGLPPRDRSSDRNEQHHAALEHHLANTAWPRRAVRSGTCMHLLIAGSTPSPVEDGDLRVWPERVPVLRVMRGQQRSLMSPVDEYHQVSISTGQALDRCSIFKLRLRGYMQGHRGCQPAVAVHLRLCGLTQEVAGDVRVSRRSSPLIR